MDGADEVPVAGGVAGFFFQLALGAVQRALALVLLAGREFDEHPVQRIAELALEQHAAVVEQRDDDDRAGMFDVFAAGVLAVGQRNAVVVDFEEAAVIGHAAVDFGFFQVRIHAPSSC